MEFGLKPETVQKVNSILKKFPEVEEAVLYGSRAKGNYRNGSDIDLSIKGDALTSSILDRINMELNDLLLPYLLDISLYKQIGNPDLVEHINRVGKVLYTKVTPA